MYQTRGRMFHKESKHLEGDYCQPTSRFWEILIKRFLMLDIHLIGYTPNKHFLMLDIHLIPVTLPKKKET